MLKIESHGPLIVATNFWELPEATLGKFFVSTNAGAFRLLVPDVHRDSVDEMATALGVAVSRGVWSAARAAAVGVDPVFREGNDVFEFLFDDATADPFNLHLSPLAFAGTIPAAENVGGEWVFTAWTRPRRGRPHLALQRPCRYRLSPRLPDLRPWRDT